MSTEKPGFIMILASLVVMGLTIFVLFSYQLETREQQARKQGQGLARLVSSMPWERIVNQTGRKALAEAFQLGQSNPDFAYSVITDVNNQAISEITQANIQVPTNPLPEHPASWLGQRNISTADGQQEFIESYAPIFLDQQHKGFVRIGHVQPRMQLDYSHVPFMATLTLPIFMLTPLFYFFLSQEIRPLRKIRKSIEQVAQNQFSQPMELVPSAELGGFMDQFNQFIDLTKNRYDALKSEQNELLMSSKLLSYKNKRVETILQTIPEAIMVIDEAGVVSYANDKTFSLLGVEAQEVINRKPQSWCQSRDIVNSLSIQNTTGAVTMVSLPEDSKSANGADTKLEIRNYPLFSPTDESKLLGRLIVIRDATERYYEQRSQGEFVSKIAHELKTPLNVLAMYSESLIDDDITSAEHRIEAANVIHDEVERLSSLIQNLLSITQYELGGLVIERQRVRTAEFLQDVFDNMQKSDRVKNIRFELDIPNELSVIYIDKALMRIAINNLLTNAVKYNKPGGSVRLEARESAYNVEIQVIDEGYGISEQDQKHIFDKFFRSEDANIRQQSGHGLGLSLTHQIIQIHHGDISVTSEPGQGSTFQITLEKNTE